MVRIRTYRDFWESLRVKYPQIKTVLMVTKEEDLAGRIKAMSQDQFPVLVSIIPSADSQGRNVDAVTDKHTGLIYILKKFDQSSQTDETLLNDQEETQDLLTAVKSDILNAASSPGGMFYRLDINSMHVDPEYNYLGCHGWSMALNF